MFFFPSSNLKSPITFDNDMFHCRIQLLLDKLKKKKKTSSTNHESCSRKHRTLILLYMWNYLAISEIPVKKKPIFTWITVLFSMLWRTDDTTSVLNRRCSLLRRKHVLDGLFFHFSPTCSFFSFSSISHF